jgi:hypothetical protein
MLFDHTIEDLDVLRAKQMLIRRKLSLRVAQATNEGLALAREACLLARPRRLKRSVFSVFLLESPADISIAVAPPRSNARARKVQPGRAK